MQRVCSSHLRHAGEVLFAQETKVRLDTPQMLAQQLHVDSKGSNWHNETGTRAQQSKTSTMCTVHEKSDVSHMLRSSYLRVGSTR
jgi:hypothetical protein